MLFIWLKCPLIINVCTYILLLGILKVTHLYYDWQRRAFRWELYHKRATFIFWRISKKAIHIKGIVLHYLSQTRTLVLNFLLHLAVGRMSFVLIFSYKLKWNSAPLYRPGASTVQCPISFPGEFTEKWLFERLLITNIIITCQ